MNLNEDELREIHEDEQWSAAEQEGQRRIEKRRAGPTQPVTSPRLDAILGGVRFMLMGGKYHECEHLIDRPIQPKYVIAGKPGFVMCGLCFDIELCSVHATVTTCDVCGFGLGASWGGWMTDSSPVVVHIRACMPCVEREGPHDHQ